MSSLRVIDVQSLGTDGVLLTLQSERLLLLDLDLDHDSRLKVLDSALRRAGEDLEPSGRTNERDLSRPLRVIDVDALGHEGLIVRLASENLLLIDAGSDHEARIDVLSRAMAKVQS